MDIVKLPWKAFTAQVLLEAGENFNRLHGTSHRFSEV